MTDELKSKKQLIEELQELRRELKIAREERTEVVPNLDSFDLPDSAFQDIALGSGDRLWEIDGNGVYTFVSDSVEELVGYAPEEVMGQSFFDLMDEDEAERVRKVFLEAISTKSPIVGLEIWNRTRQGGKVCFLTNALPVLDEKGGVLGYRGVDKNITRRKRTETALSESEERYREFVEGTDNLVIQTDEEGTLTFVNPAVKTYFGIEAQECLGLSLFDFVHPEDKIATTKDFFQWIASGRPSATHENRVVSRSGGIHYMLWTINLHFDQDGDLKTMSSIARDITDLKRNEEILQRQALHDRLTDLPNRTFFLDRLSRLIKTMRRHPDRQFCVLFLDLDGFKAVNDTLGHLIGDQLLVAVARRLETCLRAGDSVARLGGDEFTILMEELGSSDDAVRLAKRANQTLSLPFTIGGHEIVISASIGINVNTPGLFTAEDMLQRADMAMYRAKELGKGCHALFDQAMHADTIARRKMELSLRKAVQKKQFLAHYFPILSLETGRILGFDALVRWKHPEHGIIAPRKFITLAEEIGLITYIDEWILKEGCRTIKKWQTRFPNRPPLSICVNLSLNQILRRDLCKLVKNTLSENALDPSCLRLEIRENDLMENAETVTETLLGLEKMGVSIQVDNFGTGFSSLRLLHELPIQTLKIDFSFISTIEKNKESLDMIRTILNLARGMDIAVTAEGIENKEQLDLLKELKCEFGQGFYFSKPLEPEEAENLLASGEKR